MIEYHLKYDGSTSGAIANGSDENNATIVLTDSSNQLVVGMSVNFSIISGNAIFVDAHSQITHGVTDNFGRVRVAMTDLTAETITLKAFLATDPNIHSEITLEFVKEGGTMPVQTISLSMDVDGAIADGSDTNKVMVEAFDENNTLLSNVKVDLNLSNNAVFINGQSSGSGTTLNDGKFYLTFTNTVAGQVLVNGFADDNMAISDSTTAVFTDGSSGSGDYSIILTVTDGTASADGLDTCKVKAIVSKDGKPAVNEMVAFSLDGNSHALFSNNSSSYSWTTGADGTTSAELHNSIAEMVMVSASLPNQGSIHAEPVSVSFSAESSNLSISKVYNANKEMSLNQPVFVWNNASFNIDVQDAVGKVSAVTEASGITLNVSGNTVHVTLSSSISPNPIIHITDSTGTSVEYAFMASVSITTYKDKSSWADLLFRFEHCLTREEYHSLYAEWGPMGTYGWELTPYWTSDSTFQGITFCGIMGSILIDVNNDEEKCESNGLKEFVLTKVRGR